MERYGACYGDYGAGASESQGDDGNHESERNKCRKPGKREMQEVNTSQDFPSRDQDACRKNTVLDMNPMPATSSPRSFNPPQDPPEYYNTDITFRNDQPAATLTIVDPGKE